MCGRFTLTTELTEFARKLGVKYDRSKFSPRYNIAPTQTVYIIPNDGNNAMIQARWGIKPAWAGESSTLLTNARAEGIESKPSFRVPFKKQRCLILADGFFEWKSLTELKIKQPWYFRLTSKEVFAFAGIWGKSKDDKGVETLTCCIITTEANSIVAKIHHRMPVIVQERFQRIWIKAEQTIERLKACLDSEPAENMEKYPVSSLVNKAQNESPDCIKPI